MTVLNKRIAVEDAIADLKDEATVMFGGFGESVHRLLSSVRF